MSNEYLQSIHNTQIGLSNIFFYQLGFQPIVIKIRFTKYSLMHVQVKFKEKDHGAGLKLQLPLLVLPLSSAQAFIGLTFMPEPH